MNALYYSLHQNRNAAFFFIAFLVIVFSVGTVAKNAAEGLKSASMARYQSDPIAKEVYLP